MCFVALAFPAVPAIAKQADQGESLKIYGGLLAKYLAAGADGVTGVAYAKWHADIKDRAALDGAVMAMAAQKPSQMQRGEAFAFWANLYNALTLKVVLDAYPVASIKDIKSSGASLFDLKSYSGPWRTRLVTVEEKELSLDDIEHLIMRPTFKDARVHYAVNCASIGCPNLKQTPWTASTLERDLDAAARAYVNHPRGVKVADDGQLVVASIYSWFQEDFGGSQKGVLAHLMKYANPALNAKLKGKTGFDSHEYNWTLNAAK